MERFAAYRAQPVRGQVHLNRAEVEKLAGALHGVHAEHESLLRTLGENISEKLKIASKQPIEYGAYFLITSVVPFIDETSAAAVISSLSKKIGGRGFDAPHPLTPTQKLMTIRYTLSSLKDNPDFRFTSTKALAQTGIPRVNASLGTTLRGAINPTSLRDQRFGLFLAGLRGTAGRAQHYSAALERNRRGKPLAGGNFPRPDFANVLRARRKPVV